MPIHPGMVEPLAERTRDLYAGAEERLLGIIARQLAQGLDAPGWVEAKLAAVQQLRRAAEGVVDELGRATQLEVFDAVAEAYNVGHRSAVAELGALSDDARALVDDRTPNAQSVDRLAQEAVDVVTATHRSILRAVVDGFRDVVASVAATPLLGIGTRRQATQDAMRAFADRGIRAFVDKAGRRWQLSTYAEMAVRTATARAATEAHMRTLSDSGVDLVVVSDAPRECPLCRRWEGKVLTISGPAGARTVEAEHAVEDGRMVSVKVAGSLDEARTAGLQHPNCRHSVSMYSPGLTRTEQARSDPDGYEAGQRQREIERGIRKWKRREAAAVTPEAQRLARAKVRQWQGVMRDHLAAHPDLRRNRERERIGAGNLPVKREEATPEQVEAARVWSGDEASLRAMSDDDLAAALHTDLLDSRAHARIEAEADRRDLAALLDRAAPGGTLADDLAEFSDDELGRVIGHVDDADALRIAAEMDRRDVAARLPGVRPDLVGLSDDQLAERVRHAIEHGLDDVDQLAAEAHRRDLLAALFPAGRLLDDLADLSDDQLAWVMQYATDDELLRIADEFDRRDGIDAAPLPAPADTGDPVADMLTDRDTLADVLGAVPDPLVWGALAGDGEGGRDWWALSDEEIEQLSDEEFAQFRESEAAAAYWQRLADREAQAAEDAGQAAAPEHRITRAEARQMYGEWVQRQILAAEEATNGYMFNKKAETKGYSYESLFTGPHRIGYARASDELKEWWETHPRLTQAEFITRVTGQTQRWASRAVENRFDHERKR
ncbi:phage minor capsid protein [Streptomyces sp. OfavH-34-F]|uniref:phage minor capsid protein n=1 Tax=Streptomyces sp. OfavH-34-F TaxID=2917760 RepID=UPI001EF32F4A|nr:phage minor capsid protein [Streptomyces sp. OfavH-34-F]MCG7524933.1 phage minor capsid protein [Streptomyces sp. OfavH-34-F]